MANNSPITKSLYLSGLQCSKRLWREVHSPEAIPPPSPALLRQFEVGREIGAIARQRYSEGVLISGESRSEVLALTQKCLEEGVATLFEPAFEFNGVYVRCNILTKN